MWLLLAMSPERLLSVGAWLAGGVLAHDVVLAPLTVALVLLGARLLPRPARLPVALVGLVWATVGIVALPVLSGRGGADENTTLLDRPYGPAWALLTTVAVVVAVGWTALRARRPGAKGP